MDSEKMSTSQYLVFSTYTNSSAQTMPLDDRCWNPSTMVDLEEGLKKSEQTDRTNTGAGTSKISALQWEMFQKSQRTSHRSHGLN